jgi:hypothetical protein
MTTDNLRAKNRFKYTGSLDLDYSDDTVRVACCNAGDAIISIFDADLDVDQARKLRDWLNVVLP